MGLYPEGLKTGGGGGLKVGFYGILQFQEKIWVTWENTGRLVFKKTVFLRGRVH